MAHTEEELDRLCGGQPQHKLRCSCGWETRAYYALGEARSALILHRVARHYQSRAVEPDRGGGAR
jgi:hypothetical protein